MGACGGSWLLLKQTEPSVRPCDQQQVHEIWYVGFGVRGVYAAGSRAIRATELAPLVTSCMPGMTSQDRSCPQSTLLV